METNLVKPSELFKQFIAIASKYVEKHDVLKKEQVDTNKGVYSLRNTNYPIVKEERPHFYLLRVKNSRGLFIHISVTLRPPYNGAGQDVDHIFEGVSIQFYQGTNKLFCRAEWDVKEEKGKLVHPQPHWHFGDSEENNKDAFMSQREFSSSFLEEIVEKEPSAYSLPAVSFEELHYAMSAKWIMQDEDVEDFTPKHLYDWMNRCIGHVIDQYNYQVNKRNFKSSRI